VFCDSVLFLAFQQFLELPAPSLVRGFSVPWNSSPVLQHCPAVVDPPSLIRVATIRCHSPISTRSRSPVCRSPSIHPASAIDPRAAVYAASTILSAAPLRDVFRVWKAPSLKADAPSAMVAQVVCQVEVAHSSTSEQLSVISYQRNPCTKKSYQLSGQVE